MRHLAKALGVILVMALVMVAAIGCIAAGGYTCYIIIKSLLTII